MMKNYRILVGALVALAMTACSDDKGDSPKNPGETTDVFLKVNIITPSADAVGGRATDNDFSNGEGDENVINNVSLIFYDARGNVYTTQAVTSADAITDGNNNESPNVELVKTIKTSISLTEGRYPSYMMVYVNPINSSDISGPLSSVIKKTRTTYMGGNGKFAMNNSTYYDASGVLQRAVPVSSANFYVNDESEATAVNVYVERVAAKVTLKGSTDASALGTQSGELDGKQLAFTVTGWGLNAEARETYLSKYFDNVTSEYTYSGMNDLMGTNGNSVWWNDPARHRSYWAITPFFRKPENNIEDGTYKFPYVSDHVDKTGNNTTVLNYNKWNDMTASAGSSKYTMENTVEAAFFNNNPYQNSSLISAVVAGYYTVGGEQKDFYVQGEKIYLEEEYLAAMAKNGAVIVKSDGSPVYEDTEKSELNSIFRIYHPTTPTVGDATRGVEENKVTIEFIGDRSKYKYKLGNADAVEITDANIKEINDRLYSNCGVASMYKGGKAYFNVPIRHLAQEPTGTDEALPNGYYGVVRNHVYEINVSGFAELSFETMGEGVRDPEDPIVPPTDPSGSIKILASIKSLAWRVVPQTVQLGKK